MLLCPMMWYGNAREQDMDFGQFCVMFRSIFLEGFARPPAGVRLILRNLVRRFRAWGANCDCARGVRTIQIENGQAVGVVSDNGEQLEARNILSSAGIVGDHAAQRRTGRRIPPAERPDVLHRGDLDPRPAPAQLGHDQTIVFFNDSPQFHWERPREELCDARIGRHLLAEQFPLR